MIDLRLRPPDQPAEPSFYRLADRLLSADVELPELAAFRAIGAVEPPATVPSIAGNGTDEVEVFAGRVPLGDTSRDVICQWKAPGYELSVTDVGTFRVARDGRWIQGEPRAAAPEREVATAVLGPALILALALQEVWCLHASAVELDGRAVAFVGDSGAGKSTLGAELPGLIPAESAPQTLADDVLPVSIASPGPRALPRFPQLKHPPDRQPGAGVSTALSLGAIHVLDTSDLDTPGADAAGDAGEVAVEEIGGAAATLALVRHTIAARLFTPELLRRHVDFCARLADQVPISRLCYPRTRNALPRVAAAVAGRLT